MMNDLISRQAAIDAMEYWFGIDASEAIERLPSAQPDPSTCWGCNCPKMDFKHTPERKKGKWVFDDPISADFECSECLRRQDYCTRCCPNCGAYMWSEYEEEDGE